MMKAMRKVDCQTTQEEAIRILQNLKYLSVAMLNADGSPYNVVVDCLYDDGKIYFHSANEGQKLDCIRHDPRVCAVGYSGATSDAANSTTRYASVVIHGKAHILEDKERKLDICRYYYTPLVTGEIAEDITAYFATSEQFPTACALGVLVDRDQSVSAAGGYLIQLLPGADDAVIDKVERGIQQVGYVTHAFQEGVTPLELVQKVLGEFEVEVLETTPVEYRCYCSRERVSRALISLGVDELQKMLDEQGQAQLSCHFCNKEYTFDKAELEQLIQSIQQG